jgi:hypothetical protein
MAKVIDKWSISGLIIATGGTDACLTTVIFEQVIHIRMFG